MLYILLFFSVVQLAASQFGDLPLDLIQCKDGFEIVDGKCQEPEDDFVLPGCNEGLVLINGRCTPIDCGVGGSYKKSSQKCECDNPNAVFDEKTKVCVSCGNGEEFNIETSRCEKDVEGLPKPCRNGKNFCKSKNRCEKAQDCSDDGPASKCPPGSTLDNMGACKTKINDNCIASASDFTIRTSGDDCEHTCESFKDQGYKCVETSMCQILTPAVDINRIFGPRNGKNPLKPDCCSTDIIQDISDGACPDGLTCCRVPDNFDSIPKCTAEDRKNCPVDQSVLDGQCGRIINSTRISLINGMNEKNELGQSTTQPGEFPHMCVLYRIKEDGTNLYVGGASLISKDKVLTVAHRFLLKTNSKSFDLRDSEEFFVRCGEHNIKRPNLDINDSQDRKVTKIILHPDYDENLLKNDIAILQVREDFEFKNHISPVCLPNESFDSGYDGYQQCVSTGWGSSSSEKNIESDFLKKVTLPIVNRDKCRRIINNLPRFSNSGKRFVLHKDWICVGGGKEDTCRGDGGSPHVCNIDGKWVQVGVVAFGFGCGEGVPAIYSNVASAMCWIDWVMSCPSSKSVKDAVSLRESSAVEVKSLNNLKERDCDAWFQSHQDLKNQCEVTYER